MKCVFDLIDTHEVFEKDVHRDVDSLPPSSSVDHTANV